MEQTDAAWSDHGAAGRISCMLHARARPIGLNSGRSRKVKRGILMDISHRLVVERVISTTACVNAIFDKLHPRITFSADGQAR